MINSAGTTCGCDSPSLRLSSSSSPSTYPGYGRDVKVLISCLDVPSLEIIMFESSASCSPVLHVEVPSDDLLVIMPIILESMSADVLCLVDCRVS